MRAAQKCPRAWDKKMRAAQKRPRAWDKKMRAAREKMRPPFYHAEASRDTQGARLNLPLGIFFFGAARLCRLLPKGRKNQTEQPRCNQTEQPRCNQTEQPRCNQTEQRCSQTEQRRDKFTPKMNNMRQIYAENEQRCRQTALRCNQKIAHARDACTHARIARHNNIGKGAHSAKSPAAVPPSAGRGPTPYAPSCSTSAAESRQGCQQLAPT